MPPAPPLDRARTKLMYDWAAERYLRALPPEHFMEAYDHANQRKITLAGFDYIHERRPDVHVFNEMLVLYPGDGADPDKPHGVVPDNFVVVHAGPVEADTNYAIPLQPAGPFLVLEYVSENTRRKDYEDNYRHYERWLKVPYYLLFRPHTGELTLYRRVRGRYRAIRPDAAGRVAVPELELEAGLLDGWVRYWFRGKLVPVTGELTRLQDATQARLDATRGQLAATEGKLTATEEKLAASDAEIARLREEIARLKGG